jgi:acetyltransferase-like isoleucine patch superfamily enzyme
MILLFDLIWWLGAIPVWGIPGAAAVGLLAAAWPLLGPWTGLLLPVAYGVFLLVLVLVLGALSLVVPKEREGTSRVFVDREFFWFLLRWGMEKYVPEPLVGHIQLLTGLRLLHYRLQGMHLSWSSHISPGAKVWNPALIRLGHLTYVGDFAHLSGHLSQGDKLLLAPIEVGDRTNLGAHSRIGPGARIGADVRIGALCVLAPGTEIEDEVELGPACMTGMGVKIGKGARIEPRSFLASWSTVPPGEVWAGDPAGKVGEVRATRGERRRRKRRRGES